MHLRTILWPAVIGAISLVAASTRAGAQDADELSKALANPVAAMISVPLQGNFDFGAGATDDGFAYTLNVQPVIPFSLNEDWTLISRTIMPIGFRDYFPGGDVAGFGDITQSFFFSPKTPGPGGLIWGAGPAFLLPTATDDFLGTGKWGAGPTAVVLVQRGPWTVGALANHIWSFAGDEARPDVNQTFLQPFLSYGLGKGRSIGLNTESSYDWTTDQWTVPINLSFSQVFKIGEQAMSVSVGGKYFAVAPEGSPQWGVRTVLTFLFPTQ